MSSASGIGGSGNPVSHFSGVGEGPSSGSEERPSLLYQDVKPEDRPPATGSDIPDPLRGIVGRELLKYNFISLSHAERLRRIRGQTFKPGSELKIFKERLDVIMEVAGHGDVYDLGWLVKEHLNAINRLPLHDQPAAIEDVFQSIKKHEELHNRYFSDRYRSYDLRVCLNEVVRETFKGFTGEANNIQHLPEAERTRAFANVLRWAERMDPPCLRGLNFFRLRTALESAAEHLPAEHKNKALRTLESLQPPPFFLDEEEEEKVFIWLDVSGAPDEAVHNTQAGAAQAAPAPAHLAQQHEGNVHPAVQPRDEGHHPAVLQAPASPERPDPVPENVSEAGSGVTHRGEEHQQAEQQALSSHGQPHEQPSARVSAITSQSSVRGAGTPRHTSGASSSAHQNSLSARGAGASSRRSSTGASRTGSSRRDGAATAQKSGVRGFVERMLRRAGLMRAARARQQARQMPERSRSIPRVTAENLQDFKETIGRIFFTPFRR